MAHKYYVFSACRSCGKGYESRAKPTPDAPNTCKHCGSTRTKKMKARKA